MNKMDNAYGLIGLFGNDVILYFRSQVNEDNGALQNLDTPILVILMRRQKSPSLCIYILRYVVIPMIMTLDNK